MREKEREPPATAESPFTVLSGGLTPNQGANVEERYWTAADQERFLSRLSANCARRVDVERVLDAARAELAKLIAEGITMRIPIATMAKHAGISRETAYKYLERVDR